MNRNTWLSLTILFHFSRLVDDLESSEDEPRDCNFFEEHIFKPSPSTTSTNPSNPVWLRMIKCPADYESDTEPYLGPPLLL